jgi:NAD(P)-dependent dehydrogenase (short-subunit alcohol dehydrogenase family)
MMAELVVKEIQGAGGTAAPSFDSVSSLEGAQNMVNTAVQAFGRVDIVVNNAGILRDKTILKMEEAMWDAVIAVHLKGTFAVTQAAARRMAEQGQGGRIINTSSIAGLIGNFGQSNYGAAKAGIVGFTRVAAIEFAKHNITVNAIVPLAKTRMTEDVAFVAEELKPEFISPLAVFLASDLAKDVTGRLFAIAGGKIQEFRYEVTQGVKKDGMWTAEEIAARFGEITQ